MDHRDETIQKRLWDGKIEALIAILSEEGSRVYGLDMDNTIRALNFLVCGGGKARVLKNEAPLSYPIKDLRDYMHGKDTEVGRILVKSYNKTPLQDEL